MQIGTRALQSGYDSKSDTLFLYSKKERASASISLGNVGIHFAKDGTVLGLEFLNATETVPPLLFVTPKRYLETGQKLKSEVLDRVSKAHVSVHTAADFLIITFELHIGESDYEGRLNLPVPAPNQARIAQLLARE